VKWLLSSVCFAMIPGGFLMSNPSEAAEAAKRTVALSAADKVYSLGGSIPLQIRYTNRSAGPVTFEEPAKTWEVQLGIHQGEVGMDLPFGKIIRTAERGKVRWSKEDAETIRLAAGASFEFSADAGARWPERFFLGKQSLQVKDLTEQPALQSNVVEIRVEYTAETFPALLAILESPDHSEETKAFASRWVKRLYPTFDSTADSRERAAAWWEQNRESPQIRSILENINRSAGGR